MYVQITIEKKINIIDNAVFIVTVSKRNNDLEYKRNDANALLNTDKDLEYNMTCDKHYNTY